MNDEPVPVQDSSRRLKIKKYPNRRFYDATRSCHVTLAEMHALIKEGYDLEVTDSATGENITNLVLTHILIERDPPKLEFLPSSILHQVIRTQQQLLGSVFEDFFRQMVDAQKASQDQWQRFLQNTFGFPIPANPLDWTRAMMRAMGTPRGLTASSGSSSRLTPGAEQELQDLREQMSELMRRVEALSRKREE